MSAMIKYLVSTAGYKQDFLLPLYQKVSEDKDPFGAVFETTAAPDSWWHHFLSEYLVGNIYDDFNIFGWEETIQVSFAQDTEKTITRSYPDLSGKLFKISLKNAANYR